MNTKPKIEITALIHQLETYKVDQEYKLELAQALMLGAAMGLQQQYHKIGLLESKLKKLEKLNEDLIAKLGSNNKNDL